MCCEFSEACVSSIELSFTDGLRFNMCCELSEACAGNISCWIAEHVGRISLKITLLDFVACN
ncbi:hypothetical protein V6Z12_A03G033400 [Gossypium hirsutum]